MKNQTFFSVVLTELTYLKSHMMLTALSLYLNFQYNTPNSMVTADKCTPDVTPVSPKVTSWVCVKVKKSLSLER